MELGVEYTLGVGRMEILGRGGGGKRSGGEESMVMNVLVMGCF